MAKAHPVLSSLKMYLKSSFPLREDWNDKTLGTVTYHQMCEGLRKVSLVDPRLYRLFVYSFLTHRNRNDIANAFSMDPSTLKRHWDTAALSVLNFIVNEEIILPVYRCYSSRLYYFIKEEKPHIAYIEDLLDTTIPMYCAKQIHKANISDLVDMLKIQEIATEKIGDMATSLLLSLDARKSETYNWIVTEHEGYRELPPIDIRQMDRYTPGCKAE